MHSVSGFQKEREGQVIPVDYRAWIRIGAFSSILGRPDKYLMLPAEKRAELESMPQQLEQEDIIGVWPQRCRDGR